MMEIKAPIARSISVCILIALIACTNPGNKTPTPTISKLGGETDRPIVLGDISDDPAEVIEGTQPLADYMASQLANYGITDGRVKIASTTGEMTQLLKNGQVDLYFDSVYPATLISDSVSAKIILRRWRFGVADYHAVIFASQESGITSVDDLHGHLIAMDSPYSTSGFFLPAVFLTEQGVNLTGKRSYNDPVADDELGFVFSYDDENTLLWVLNGLVAAGVTDDYHFDVDFPADVTDKLVVLGRTEAVPRQVVVVRGDLDPDLISAIIRVLIKAHETEAGSTALEPFQTTRFDEFPQGIDAAAEQMRTMMQIVQGLTLP